MSATVPDQPVISELRNASYIDPDAYEQQDSTTCLSFAVSGFMGLFSRFDSTKIVDTYDVPPRTTLAGIISGILGLTPNSYHDVFGPETSKIAVELLREPRTLSMANTIMKTADEDVRSMGGSRGFLIPDETSDRDLRNKHVLIDPAYRVDVWVSTVPVYNHLKYMLREGKSFYTPSLGVSEYLTNVEYLGEHEIGESRMVDQGEIASVLPGTSENVIPDADTRVKTIKTPMFMTQTRDELGRTGRKTTEFSHITYNPAGGPEASNGSALTVVNQPVTTVDSRNVVFY